MSTPIPPSPSEPNILPPDLPDVELESSEGASFAERDKMSKSPFAAMFKGGATHEEVSKFVNSCLMTIAREIKRTQERWEKNQKRLRRIMAGQNPDD